MQDLSRRTFMKTATLTTGGLLLSGVPTKAHAIEPSHNQNQEKSIDLKIFNQEHKVKSLPFDAKKLKGISEKLIVSHWENNYAGSVKTLNAVNKKLAEALLSKDTPPFLYGDLKREHLMRTGSVVYHEIYFANLGGEGQPSGGIRKALEKQFNGFENWESEFKKIGQSLGGGSGWVVLAYNLHLGWLENYWLSDHLHGPASSIPLLVMDMYEHSYQMDYGAAAAKYIDAFFQNVHWEEVEKRFEQAKKWRS